MNWKLILGIVAENALLLVLVIGAKNMQMAQMDLRVHVLQNRLDAQTQQTTLANQEIERVAGQARDCVARIGQYQAYLQQVEAQSQVDPSVQQITPLLRVLRGILF